MKMAGLTAAGAILGGTSDTPKAEAAAPPAPSADFSEAELPVLFDVDVCVVGGGAAGTAAGVEFEAVPSATGFSVAAFSAAAITRALCRSLSPCFSSAS